MVVNAPQAICFGVCAMRLSCLFALPFPRLFFARLYIKRQRNKERKRDEPKKDANEGPFLVPALLFVAA